MTTRWWRGTLFLCCAACHFEIAEVPLGAVDGPTGDAPLVLEDAAGVDGRVDAQPALDARSLDGGAVDAPQAIDAPPPPDAGPADAAPDGGCTPPAAECDGDQGTVCETRLDTDSDCGACDRACQPRGGQNRCVAGVTGFDCAPVCDGDHADCDGDTANGCELDVPGDLGEPDDSCPGTALGDLDEGQTRVATRRIFPADDLDVFAVTLREGEAHLCTPGDPLAYTALVVLAAPSGASFRLRRLADDTQCQGATTVVDGDLCFTWDGKCDLPASRTVYFEVDGAGAAQSCTPYAVSVKFCRAGTSCEECRLQ